MLIQVPTFSEAIAVVRSRVRLNRSTLSTLAGSVAGDLYVVPQALSDVQQQALTYYTAVRQALLDLLALKNDANSLALIAQATNSTVAAVLQDISAAIDSYASNVSETRKQPTPANGTASFGRADAPTQDLPVGIGVTVTATNGQQFVTTGAVIMYAAGASSYFDPTEQLYLVAAPVQATVSGSAGNIAVNGLASIVTPVNGLPLVTNLSDFSGGRDLETDEDFVARLLLKWQAVGKITPAGVQLAIADAVSAGSLYLAPPKNPVNLRGFGVTDVWVQNRISETVTEVLSAFNHPTVSNAIKPAKGPALALLSVSSGVAFLQADQSSALQGSVQAQDALRFSTLPSFPVTITYTRNRMVSDAQAVFDDSGQAPLNYVAPTDSLTAVQATLLVRQAPQLLVDYTVAITVLPGYTKALVVSAVQTALINFGDALVLGQPVNVDDLNKIVEGVPGVLRLAGLPIKFSPTNSSGVLSVITPAANSAVVFNNLNIF